MPLVKTTISYEDEEFGGNEVISYQREVGDLDVHSWLWYMVKVLESAGFDCQQLQMISSDNKVYRTDL